MNEEKSTKDDTITVANEGTGLSSLLMKLKLRRNMRMLNKDSAENSKQTHDSTTKGTENVESYVNIDKGVTKFKNGAASTLEQKIIRQIEYYYGDYNLPKDRFLQEIIKDNPGGWVSMDTMLTFKRLSDISRDADQIMEALCKSSSGLMEVDFSGRRIRRKPEKELPELTEARKLEIEDRTLFVSGFNKETTTLDDILEYFENKVEGVSNVRMRYQREEKLNPSGDTIHGGENSDIMEKSIFTRSDQPDNRRFLGSVFVTFNSKSLAKDFMDRAILQKNKSEEPSLTYNGQKLKVITVRQYHQRRVENNDQFLEDTVKRTVYVQGFDKADTDEKDLVEYFGQFDGAESVRKRVYRSNVSEDDKEGEWIFLGSVFVTFNSQNQATCFLKEAQDLQKGIKYKGDSLKVKWQEEFYEERGKFKREIKKLRENLEE